LQSFFLLDSSVSKLLLYEENNYDLVKFGKRVMTTFHTRRTRIDRFKVSFLCSFLYFFVLILHFQGILFENK